MQHDAGAATSDIARLETAGSIGILSNTVPSTFWTLFELYSRPALLSAVRDEVRAHALNVDKTTGRHAVDLGRIRDACPRLVSAFQEVLRVHSNGAPTRVVYKDVLLNDEYLLKGGAVLQMPAPAVNNEALKWGGDAGTFDPDRFLKQKDRNAEKQPGDRPKATSFMSFGASPNMCPGRHFASGEILALAAMLVLRFDVTPAAAGAGWWAPRLNAWAIAASMTPPVEDYPVVVREREEFAGREWAFDVAEGKGLFALITG